MVDSVPVGGGVAVVETVLDSVKEPDADGEAVSDSVGAVLVLENVSKDSE